MITAGQLAPGDRLTPERELASEMGVSRNVVRRRFASLSTRTCSRPARAPACSSPRCTIESLIEPLELVLALESATLHSLAQARLVIEPGIAALAAQPRPTSDLRGAGGAARGAPARRGRRLRALPARSTSSSTGGSSGWPTTPSSCGSWRASASSRAGAATSRTSSPDAPPAHADHERIVAALRARDPDAAREAMREHLEHVAHSGRRGRAGGRRSSDAGAESALRDPGGPQQ